MGQYTQVDPIGFAGGNPTLYGYVYNPFIDVDLLGLRQINTTHNVRINLHHLIPQEMLNNSNFMKQLDRITGGRGVEYIHRQLAAIDSNLHKNIHRGPGGGMWNSQFKEWALRNPTFTQKDLQRQIGNMMKEHNLPNSSRNFNTIYRKCGAVG